MRAFAHKKKLGGAGKMAHLYKSLLLVCAWLALLVVFLTSASLMFVVHSTATKYAQAINGGQVIKRDVISSNTARHTAEFYNRRGRREKRLLAGHLGFSGFNENIQSWANISGPVDKIGSPVIRRELKRILFGLDSNNRKYAFEKIVALSSLLPPLTNISRMKTPSPETFRNYIAPAGLPVIFTDMLEGQKLGGWTWDYVRSKWGEVVYQNVRQGDFLTKTSKNGKHIINRVTITLKDFIDVITGKREAGEKEMGLYIAKKRVIPVEVLESEFYYPPFYPGAHKSCYLEPTGWLGAPGTFTQGHIDSKDNFVYQIIGKKRWTIFPPQDHKFLYYTQGKGSLEWSRVLNSFNIEPDLKKYPLFAKTRPITFEVVPGEVLYLPRGWTHTVANISPNLMINTWRYGPAAITQNWLESNNREIRKYCY